MVEGGGAHHEVEGAVVVGQVLRHPGREDERCVPGTGPCRLDHRRCGVDAGELHGLRTATGERSQQVPRPAPDVEDPGRAVGLRQRQLDGAVGDVVVEPAEHARVVGGRTVVERVDVAVRRHAGKG